MKLAIKVLLFAAAIFYVFPNIAGITIGANVLQVLALAVLIPLAEQGVGFLVGNAVGLLHQLSGGALTPLSYPFLVRTAHVIFPSLTLGFLSLILPQFMSIASVGAALTGALVLTYITTLLDYYMPTYVIVRMGGDEEGSAQDEQPPKK